MIRSKTLKDSSRGFQASSEISFLISVRKTLPISGQTLNTDVTPKNFCFWQLNAPWAVGRVGPVQSAAFLRVRV